ncbi:hypothetical protein E3U43_011497 [Larimichthys crocea]|uniref:Uncharacterized protein n=1 Tax=Larimichthys crocea TaxID=215358 RepID=A0ACD3QKN6_LARCR|nr:hypothetical protein E3U43_011497 [Larimichthys crocea]
MCVRECLLLYLLLFLRTVFSPYRSVTLLDLQRCVFRILHLCFNLQLPFLSTSPPSSKYGREGSVCQSRRSCFEAGETNYHRQQKLSTPASSLKSPPTSYPPCRRSRCQIPHR